MNIRQVKTPEVRVDVRYLSQLGIKAYGTDNLYPQKVAQIIDASPTGSQCLERYIRFIEGNGFEALNFAEMVVNNQGETADDLCSQSASDLARYGGFALHVDYNIMGEVTEVRSVPFEACRLAEDDDSGYIGRVYYHADWRGKRTRNGKQLRVNRESIKAYPMFNPQPEVVQAQIAAAGGIENYKGQILYVGMSRGSIYPKTKYDAALTELSTDEGLANVKYRNVRNNFLTSSILITRKSMSMDEAHAGYPNSGYSQELAQFQGDTTALNIMEIVLDVNEEKPELMEFPTKNFDKDFTATEQSTTERIYAIFEQEPFLAIRNGKLGFSGDVIQDAYNYYSALCGRERRVIERAYAQVFGKWSGGSPTDNYTISPLVFSTDEEITLNDEQL